MTLSRIVPAGGTTGQVLAKTSNSAHDVEWATGGGGGGITELTGDVTAGPGSGAQAATVGALQNQPVSAALPSGGDVLQFNAGSWGPAAVSGITQLTGDVTAGPGAGSQVATVAAIQGLAVLGVIPNDDDVLTWNAGTVQWEPVAPGAGGGLSEYQVRARVLYGYR